MSNGGAARGEGSVLCVCCLEIERRNGAVAGEKDAIAHRLSLLEGRRAAIRPIGNGPPQPALGRIDRWVDRFRQRSLHGSPWGEKSRRPPQIIQPEDRHGESKHAVWASSRRRAQQCCMPPKARSRGEGKASSRRITPSSLAFSNSFSLFVSLWMIDGSLRPHTFINLLHQPRVCVLWAGPNPTPPSLDTQTQTPHPSLFVHCTTLHLKTPIPQKQSKHPLGVRVVPEPHPPQLVLVPPHRVRVQVAPVPI